MNNKFFLGVLIILFIIGLGVFVFLTGNSTNGNSNASIIIKNNNDNNIVNEVTSQSIAVQSSELTKHSAQNDCWVVYKNKVYDITSFLPIHPGSAAAIVPYCGTEGFESAFTKKHGTKKVSMFMKIAQYKGDLI